MEELLTSYGAARPIMASGRGRARQPRLRQLPVRPHHRVHRQLPEEIRQLTVVKERRALAQSKVGDHLPAIGELQALIELSGDSSERQGLLGGRYKKLAKEARKPRTIEVAARYLGEGNRALRRGA